ncbi:hypothetical protein [Heyndrickxia ginsengihumi]|uniref:hypothetical protein n=1 Tax=Heyndrickxia ginsengihumi TaxID=363870 RepID=UPI001D855250|nr:hypothetical protein [Heyndrickxia ginsengihumi]MBE6183877.1 hypothetical protein [Bacillus sp. (in: firmicutes)]MCM3022477.1 hypothetical protein [Heyndrickxia ginsengihumi]
MLNSIIGNALSNLQEANMKTFEFKVGQVFSGKIQHLYPNNMAMVQAGSHSFIAKLQIPMEAGKNYWFQVTSIDGEVHLKQLVSQSNADNQSTAVLSQLSISSTKQHRELVSFFTKEHIPFTKEMVTNMGSWLKEVPDMNKGMQTIKAMITNQFPISQDVFRSLTAAEQPITFHSLLNNLLTQLKNEPQVPSTQSMSAIIHSILESNHLHLAEKVIRQLTNLGQQQNEAANRILQKIGFVLEPSIADRQQIDLNENTNPAKPSSMITKETLESALHKLQPLLFSDLEQGVANISKEEADLLKQLLNQANQDVDRADILSQLKATINKLGMFYENEIGQADSFNVEDSLKPLLVQYLQEVDQHSKIRDNVELLLMKMNGQQILSVEQTAIQQILFQIPFQFPHHQSELTFQWTGKKTEDGKIDSNFCKILFYLQLQYLGDILIEMNVQHRIVTLKVSNEHPYLKQMAQPFMPALKAGLEQLNYTLSSVHYLPFAAHSAKQPNSVHNAYTNFKGVDIRI